MDNLKLEQIYLKARFKDSLAVLLYKNGSKYYYDKSKQIEVKKSEMFELFTNSKLIVVDNNGKYTEVASCTPNGDIKEAGTGGGTDGKSAYEIAVEVGGYEGTYEDFGEGLSQNAETMTKSEMLDILRGGELS